MNTNLKKHAYVLDGVDNRGVADWIASRPESSLKVSTSGDSRHWPEFDLVVEELSGDFNEQYEWFKMGKRLSEWKGEPFHLNNRLVKATWLCGKRGVEAITFVDVVPEDFCSDGEVRRTERAMKKLVEDFDLGMRFTRRSGVVDSLRDGDVKIRPPIVNDPISVSRVDGVLENGEIEASGIRVPSDIGPDGDLRVTRGALTEGKVILLENGTSEQLRRAILQNPKKLFLLSAAAKQELKRLERVSGCKLLSVQATSALLPVIDKGVDRVEVDERFLASLDHAERQLIEGIKQKYVPKAQDGYQKTIYR